MTNNTMTDNTMTNNSMTTYDRAINNMKSKTTDMLRGANRYGVLEDSDGEKYESEARLITTGRVLRSIVNQSSTMTTMTNNTMTDNTMTNNSMTTYDRAINNMKSKTTDMLRGANRYGVLEDSDDEECMNNKVQNVRFENVRE